MRFNIAFVPKYNSKEFIDIAESFKPKPHNYSLGDNSLPHITICQFIADENKISQIWDEVCTNVSEYTISLICNSFSHISFDEKLFWLSLMPESNQHLMDTYNRVLKIVQPIRSDTFDPHLTLFNYFPEEPNINFPIFSKISIKGEFELILGESDNAGQLKNIIFYSQNDR